MLVKISFDEVMVNNSGDEGSMQAFDECKKAGFEIKSVILDVDTSKVTVEEIDNLSKDVNLEVLSY